MRADETRIQNRGESIVSPRQDSKPNGAKNEFEKAGEGKQLSLVEEFFLFVVQNKKWWLIPILLVLGLFGLLIVLGASGAAPFIYTLF